MAPKIITIVGKSNSGKTTLLEKIVRELTQRGVRIGSVKHAHDGFEMDKKGKDSWRHRQAGAASTLVVSDNSLVLVKSDSSPFIDKMKACLSDRDIILAEGFKKENLPKIEVFRTDSIHEEPLCLADENLVAFVTDSGYQPDVPVFGLEDIREIADFIQENFLQDATGISEK